MKSFSNKTWKISEEIKADEIKNWLLANGGIEQPVNTKYEIWRIKFSDATLTYYSSGKLYCTDSDDPALINVHKYIHSLIGSQFICSNRKYLIGFDETGKGEVIGHTVLAGVIIPNDFYDELEIHIGVADTKIKHEIKYWDEIFKKLDFYTGKGFKFEIQRIPPWQIDRYNINKLFDVVYQRMLNILLTGLNFNEVRIVIDDYGIGFHLDRYLNTIRNAGAEVIKATKADENYLESKVASLIAKREQQKIIEAISENKEFQLEGVSIGSGNAGDPVTLQWLKKWKETGKEWPWFVKRSFKPIRELDGKIVEYKKENPPLNESTLSEDFKVKFNEGKLNITSLAIICPSCGNILKAIKLIQHTELGTLPLCISCEKEIPDLQLTLQYYCGKILPDSSAIARGFISKDLESKKFFENFTFLLHPTVRYETDQHPGGKKAIQKLGNFAAMGRIRFEEIESIFNAKKLGSTERDESILEDVKKYNAILLTADNNMKGVAQAKGLFVMEI